MLTTVIQIQIGKTLLATPSTSSHPYRLRDKAHARSGDPVSQAAEREQEPVRLEDVDAHQTPGRGDQSDGGALPEEVPHGSNKIAGLGS